MVSALTECLLTGMKSSGYVSSSNSNSSDAGSNRSSTALSSLLSSTRTLSSLTSSSSSVSIALASTISSRSTIAPMTHKSFGSSSSSPSAPPPCYSIDAMMMTKRSTNKRSNSSSSTDSSSNKRQKQQQQQQQALLDEQLYVASTVFDSLDQAGRKIPAIRTTCPRGLPPLLKSGLGDMRQRVHLVHSKEFDSKKSQQQPLLSSSSSNISPLTFSEELCSALIQATASFYQIPEGYNSSNNDRDNKGCSSSSSSSSEDDEGTGSITDSADGETDSSVENNDDATAAEDSSSSANNKLITMGEALQITKHPRIVTLASAPFSVVHVNAAYLALTGLPSASILGRPFQEVCANEKDWTDLLEKSSPSSDDAAAAGQQQKDVSCPFSLMQIHGQGLDVLSLKSNNDGGARTTTCCDVKLSVNKIGCKPDKVSHFAMELHPQAATTGNEDRESSSSVPIRARAASAHDTTDFGMVVA